MPLNIDVTYKDKIIIEGTSEKTWNLTGLSISLKSEYMKYFVILLSDSDKYDYYVHFENESNVPYTEEEKDILFRALSQTFMKGDIITTDGGVTPGGISALYKLVELYGFEIIGQHTAEWASLRMLNSKQLEKWLKNPKHNKDFKVIDKTKQITQENTKPIVLVLRKR